MDQLPPQSRNQLNGLTLTPMINVERKELQKAILAGEHDSTIVNCLLQSRGLILHRKNARAILRHAPRSMDRDCSELLAASADCTSPEETNFG